MAVEGTVNLGDESATKADEAEKGMITAAQQPAVFRFIAKDRIPPNLRWKDLGFSVAVANGRKQILTGVSGELLPGKLTCILGPSGSGKTTLLNILSGRMGQGGRFKAERSGEITLNGTAAEPTKHQHVFGYVMQEDSLYATETPREILDFAARLRLQGVQASQSGELISDMIHSLGLEECADTFAGNEMIKGISGGQKKRTSIGAELITNPAITFLDEPTSGLDTAAAYRVIAILKELTNAGQSVMCTIHQPSSEIFQLFDQAIFLARGQMIYQGPPSGIRPHFASLGHACHEEYNPADFVMFMVETADGEKFDQVTKGCTHTFTEEAASPKDYELPQRPKGKGFFTELRELTKRQCRNTVRDKATLGGRFGLSIFLNLIFSFIFWQVGKENSDYQLQSHSGALTMVGINAMFACTQPSILQFPSERPVFLREHASQMYGVLPYFFSKTGVELVLLVLQVTVVWLIDYWAMGFQGSLIVHIAGTFLIGTACSSLGLMLGCSIKEVKTAVEAIPLAFVPQILFAGFFIRMEQIPVVLRWLQYICPLKWGMNILLINEFKDSKFKGGLLERNDINEDHVWIYVGVLIGLVCFYRGVGMILLSKKAKTLYG
eukprot:TRINITY_DN17657_c0_g1_i1.p1 TRINITY_DN17657_c0_g1~~TRINITY_DN17657_c0_g1_i1.p1  ORF type:complete len:609 (-),score=89.87 TRINITY_DN17657_c0_g1_i1:121-1947(-)